MIKIGTRSSQLALWQAEQVKNLLERRGFDAELIPVKSEGDVDLVTPLYAMGVQGVFTHALDAHLLSGKVDMAVHSMKDVPTQLARGICEAAVLERASARDLFIPNPNKKEKIKLGSIEAMDHYFQIASGSVRRRAQWLHQFPKSTFHNLRGNVHTRMRKLAESDWDGIIMARAGLERVQLLPAEFEEISWMLPSPAQGAILIVCREEDEALKRQLSYLNHKTTALCVHLERAFLSTLMGGCSTPISAWARVEEEELYFQGNILSPDGKDKMSIQKTVKRSEAEGLGAAAAKELLNQGAGDIVEKIRTKGHGI